MNSDYKRACEILNLREFATPKEVEVAYKVFSSVKRDIASFDSQVNVNLDDIIWARKILLDPKKKEEHVEIKYIDLVNFLFPENSEMDIEKRNDLISRFNQAQTLDDKIKLLKILHTATFRGKYMLILIKMNPEIIDEKEIEKRMQSFDNSDYETQKKLYVDIRNEYAKHLIETQNINKSK
jgi:hypothetical protein